LPRSKIFVTVWQPVDRHLIAPGQPQSPRPRPSSAFLNVLSIMGRRFGPSHQPAIDTKSIEPSRYLPAATGYYPQTMRRSAFVFDAYGTLFDVHAAVRRHAAAAGP